MVEGFGTHGLGHQAIELLVKSGGKNKTKQCHSALVREGCEMLKNS